MSALAPPFQGSLPLEGADLMSDAVQALNVMVNGAPQTTTATTLHDWVLAQGVAPQAVATAVNGQFVPRSLRAQQPLAEGDTILTFQPIVGG